MRRRFSAVLVDCPSYFDERMFRTALQRSTFLVIAILSRVVVYLLLLQRR